MAEQTTIERYTIGLGSFGSAILNKVVESIKVGYPDFAKEELENTINSFFVIDSSKDDQQTLFSIPKENKFLISPDSSMLATDNPWLPPDVGLPDRLVATERKRIISRALYRTSGQQVLNSLFDKIEEIHSIRSGQSILVTLLVALGGGTGSGMLYHMARDLKTGLSQRFRTGTINIVSIGVLPWRNDQPDELANGYAALKEIHLALKSTPWSGSEGLLCNPFDLFVLVNSGWGGKGRTNTLMAVLSRFISDLMIAPATGFMAGVGFHGIEQLISHAREHREFFTTLGAYICRYPAEEAFWILEWQERLPFLEEHTESTKKRLESLKREIDNLDIRLREVVEGRLYKLLKTFREYYKVLDEKASRTIRTQVDGIEDSKRRMEEELEEIRKGIPALEELHTNAIKEKELLQGRLSSMDARIRRPKSTTHIFTFPFCLRDEKEEQIWKILKEEREKRNGSLTDRKSARALMEEMERGAEFSQHVLDPIRDMRLPYTSLLLDYVYGWLGALRKEQLESLDDDTKNKLRKLVKLRRLLLISSSSGRNLEKVSEAYESVRERIERELAGGGILMPMTHQRALYEIVHYCIPIGIFPFSLDVTLPPPLRDLTYMKEKYDQYVFENKHMYRHSMFYGEDIEEIKRALRHLEVYQKIRSHRDVIAMLNEFWLQYEPIDETIPGWRLQLAISRSTTSLEGIVHHLDEMRGSRSKRRNIPVR